MSGNSESGSLEGTLFHLLNTGAGQQMEPGNLLLLVSMVNLMGLVNLIGHRLGVDVMSAPPVGPDAAAPSGGGRSAAPAVPPNLAGLLGSLLGPPGGARNKETSAGTENASGGGAGENGRK
ncbi:hypothetical protein [Desulfotomaculum copahuensis]|uniref:Uncharacterized protein n=1 Tax=Desulfotomaculum copahuensis TaxID=1838280 RepID=A0A1B7LFP3_9FIRM|nr:hypothetical protein [Desulfotomaculum copahuensis]OAT82953.1 hypothetical protein A6M21_08320 [Desulfotomaculum copahuensis]